MNIPPVAPGSVCPPHFRSRTRAVSATLTRSSPIKTPLGLSSDPGVVQAGDTLGKIAVKYGVTVSDIVKANNINNPDLLYIGQKLIIPETGTSIPAQPVYYTVQPGDTLWRIAQKYGTTVTNLAQLNNIDPNKPIYIGQKLRVK